MHTFFIKNKKIPSVISGILISIFVCSSFFIEPYKVNAQQSVTIVGGVGDAPGILTSIETAATAIASSISAAALKSLGIKEWALDAVAWALAKQVIFAGVRSTTQWVRSGFRGSPMFVTDPGAFMLNTADKLAGEILYGSDLKFLCSPINIRIALDFYYRRATSRNPLRCTISGAAANVDRFIQGNFLAGGWPAWLDVALVPSNSTMGAGLSAQIYMEGRIGQELAKEKMKWDWGKGFLDKKECTRGPNGVEKCTTVTPGDTIAASLNFGLTTPERSLIEADEINELIGALLQQGLMQGLSAARGLFSPTQSYGSGGVFNGGDPCANLSYYDTIGNTQCEREPNNAFLYNGIGSIFEAVQDEGSYQAMHRRITSAAGSIISEAKSRGASCGINDGVIAEAQIPFDTASSTIRASQALSLQLTFLQSQSESGTPEERLEALSQFTQIIGSGVLHDSIKNNRQLRDVDQIVKDVQSLRGKISDCTSPETATPTDGGGGSE